MTHNRPMNPCDFGVLKKHALCYYEEKTTPLSNTMKELFERIEQAESICVFTGAGVSTFCGIPDFRGPDGIYRDPDSARLFEIDRFDDDPTFFYAHADRLVYGQANTKPGPVHLAVKALQDHANVRGVITQNIDGLHERAGSYPVYAIHGSAALHHCRQCGDEKTFDEIQQLRSHAPDRVPRCACGGVYKPDITFFGEMLPQAAFEEAQALAARSDLVLVLGTSLTVQPAATIPQYTLQNNGDMVIINASPTPQDHLAALVYRDLAAFASATEQFIAELKSRRS